MKIGHDEGGESQASIINYIIVATAWARKFLLNFHPKIYGVETRGINKAVKNNSDKFPSGYIFELDKADLEDLRWKFSTAKLTKTRDHAWSSN